MYQLEIAEQLDKKFSKLAKKDPKQLEIIDKKITEIRKNPKRYKRLRGDRKGAQRVHIDSSFVLIFEVHNNTIRLLDYDHHDNIY